MHRNGGMDYTREAPGGCCPAALYYDRKVRWSSETKNRRNAAASRIVFSMVPSSPFLCCDSRIFCSMVPSPSCLCCGFLLSCLTDSSFLSSSWTRQLSQSADTCLFRTWDGAAKYNTSLNHTKIHVSFHVFIHPPFHLMFVGEFEWWLCTQGWQNKKTPSKSRRYHLFPLPLAALTQVQTCHRATEPQTAQKQAHMIKSQRGATGFSTGQLPKLSTTSGPWAHSWATSVPHSTNTHPYTYTYFHIVCLFACFLGSY